MSGRFEITLVKKADGALTKRISLGADGKLESDGSACVMSRGSAERFTFEHLREFGLLVERLGSDEAILLGRLQPSLSDKVDVVTKRELDGSGRIARTKQFIHYLPAPALALIDFDAKGMPEAVFDRIDELGGLWAALTSIVPELEHTGRVVRASTSAELYRTDTGEQLEGSGGSHVYIAVRDGTDIPRFLGALHERCWLAGLGWMMVGAGGQLLERSIVDRVVGTPERLVFEGRPVLVPPIGQKGRRAVVEEGDALDTVTTCPPASILQRAKLSELRSKEQMRLHRDSASARAAFISERANQMEKRGIARKEAERIAGRHCEGVLLPDVELPFDDPALAGKTVDDVLLDPKLYEGETLADPLEGVTYGHCKAMIMLRQDGTPWINSFAHGHTVYDLKNSFTAAKRRLDSTPADDVVETFLKLVLGSDCTEDEVEQLRNIANRISGVGKRTLDERLRRTIKEHEAARAQEEAKTRLVDRRDPRPQISAPSPDAEWLPQMKVLNDVLGAVEADEPPMRDTEGYLTTVEARCPPGLHLLRAEEANADELAKETRLPAPEQVLLTRLEDAAAAELIEHHIEYVAATPLGIRPVHLNTAFVKHFVHRPLDRHLPLVSSVATLPLVMPNGTLIAGPGLVRNLQAVFRVPLRLQAMLPTHEECSITRIARAMGFLTDDWLCDLATDYTGKCIAIACAMTIVERMLFTERPAFFVTAGQRGGGKTTLLHMISMAVLGYRAAAGAWSPNAEERRKALFSYLLEGVPFLVWDNLPRGLMVSCPSIEKALTAETYTDRFLGETRSPTAPAFMIQSFTGNNIGAKGDLSSRKLDIQLTVDRTDPENRAFRHPDPIGWTQANRAGILRAIYMLLLGNPRRANGNHDTPPTRFKGWWDLVGSAVEHAAQLATKLTDPLKECPPTEINFEQIFRDGEIDDEQTDNLAEVLRLLCRWNAGVVALKADAIFDKAKGQDDDARSFVQALGEASNNPISTISPKAITWRLKALQNMPASITPEGGLVVLKYTPRPGDVGRFQIVSLKRNAA